GQVWDTAPPDDKGDTHYAAQFAATGDDVSGKVTIASEGGFGGNGTYHYNRISVNGMTGHWIQDGAQTKLAWSSMFTWTRDTAVKTLPKEEARPHRLARARPPGPSAEDSGACRHLAAGAWP
ncbi:unnamed protein product, partial [Prorocentrum cordatum]